MKTGGELVLTCNREGSTGDWELLTGTDTFSAASPVTCAACPAGQWCNNSVATDCAPGTQPWLRPGGWHSLSAGVSLH